MSVAPPPPPQPLDLHRFLRTIVRRKWVMIACLVLLPAGVYALSVLSTKTYTSSTVLQVQTTPVDTSLFEGGGSSPQAGAIATAARLVETTGVAEEVARDLPGPRTKPADLLESVSIEPDEEGGFITITATAKGARRSAQIANAFGNAVVANRSRQARERVDRAINALRAELKTGRGDETSRTQLSEQLQRLRAVKAAQGNNAQIIEPADAPDSPASPKPVRNTVLAVFIALVLGTILVFVVERLDRRIRSPHELEDLTGLPLLTSVPASAFPGNDSSSPNVNEAFQTLRASLTYFNVDRPLRTIIVASPSKGDGKTTVATNLALSLARGGKNVLLVDADLRRPQVATRLGIHVDQGVGAVLAGEAALDDVLVDFHVSSGSLQVLPAGPPPPNPSELLGSGRMHSLMAQLAERADLVVIDSTPVLPVSDVLPLIRDVSGIVVVARLNHTTRDGISRFQEVATMAGGHLLGVVATDAKVGGLYDGYGGYGGYAGYGGYGDTIESPAGGAPTKAV